MYIQHGDVLLHKIDAIPEGSEKILSQTIHKGLNHSHDLVGEYSIYSNGADIYLDAISGCSIVHGEHKDIEIPEGFYRKSIVIEYDHLLEESRQIID